MNKTIPFNAKTLESLPRPMQGEQAAEYRSAKNPRHRLLVHQHRNTFAVRMSWQGKRYYKTIGTYPEMSCTQAAKLADQYIFDVQSGAVAKGANLTVRGFYDKHYRGYSRKHHKSHKDVLSKANKLLPVFGKYKLTDLTPLLILELLEKFSHLAPATRSGLKAWLSSLLSLAVQLEILASNPCFNVPNIPINNARHQMLTVSEGPVFWTFLRADKDRIQANALGLSIATGMRIGEVISLKKNMLASDLNSLILPITKSGKSRTVPLNSIAREIISEQLELSHNKFLFSSRSSSSGHISSPRGCFKRVTTAMKAKGMLKDGLVIHDLRRTYASLQLAATGDIRLVQQNLGHSSSKITERYAYHSATNLLAAAEATGQFFLNGGEG